MKFAYVPASSIAAARNDPGRRAMRRTPVMRRLACGESRRNPFASTGRAV